MLLFMAKYLQWVYDIVGEAGRAEKRGSLLQIRMISEVYWRCLTERGAEKSFCGNQQQNKKPGQQHFTETISDPAEIVLIWT